MIIILSPLMLFIGVVVGVCIALNTCATKADQDGKYLFAWSGKLYSVREASADRDAKG
jgi:hypothetical protein